LTKKPLLESFENKPSLSFVYYFNPNDGNDESDWQTQATMATSATDDNDEEIVVDDYDINNNDDNDQVTINGEAAAARLSERLETFLEKRNLAPTIVCTYCQQQTSTNSC
jgi:hypothetical protein